MDIIQLNFNLSYLFCLSNLFVKLKNYCYTFNFLFYYFYQDNY